MTKKSQAREYTLCHRTNSSEASNGIPKALGLWQVQDSVLAVGDAPGRAAGGPPNAPYILEYTFR